MFEEVARGRKGHQHVTAHGRRERAVEKNRRIGILIGVQSDFVAFSDGMFGVLLDASFECGFVFGRERRSDDVVADGQGDLILGHESELLRKTGIDLITDS